MNKRALIMSLVLVLSILACNLPAGGSPAAGGIATQTPIIQIITATPMDTPIPTFTSIPTETSLPTFTPTPTIPIAWPLDKGVNCRYGPSTDWVATSSLLVGQNATIQGKNGDASWWYVTTPEDPGNPCWVSASVTVTAGNLANLPVIKSPSASVIGVDVKIDPKEINLPGCLGPVQPIKINGSITVNGPTKVDWYFETQQGGSMGTYTLEFDKADTKKVDASFSPSPAAGDFWVKLITITPNGKAAETKYKINCP